MDGHITRILYTTLSVTRGPFFLPSETDENAVNRQQINKADTTAMTRTSFNNLDLKIKRQRVIPEAGRGGSCMLLLNRAVLVTGAHLL